MDDSTVNRNNANIVLTSLSYCIQSGGWEERLGLHVQTESEMGEAQKYAADKAKESKTSEEFKGIQDIQDIHFSAG